MEVFIGTLKRVHSQKMIKKNTWSTAASLLKRIKTLSVDIHDSLMSTSKAKLYVVWEVSWKRDTGLCSSADPQHKTYSTQSLQSTYMQSKSCVFDFFPLYFDRLYRPLRFDDSPAAHALMRQVSLAPLFGQISVMVIKATILRWQLVKSSAKYW